MLVLYRARGAGDFNLGSESYTPEELRLLKHNVIRLLKARGNQQAANHIESIPFKLYIAFNNFGDDFFVIYASVPLEVYENLRCNMGDSNNKAFVQLAEAIGEVSGLYIRFIAVDFLMEAPAQLKASSEVGLRQSEINKLVYRYIGVNGGYLGDFSYRSHHEFYIDLDLEINPYQYDGTTREKFIRILTENTPVVQAKILEGILKRYPVGSSELRSQERYNEIQNWIKRMRGRLVEAPKLQITSQTVERALTDAEQLLRSTGATSAVDRVHTALHAYLAVVCYKAKIQTSKDHSLTELFKCLRQDHPAFHDLGPHKNEIIKIVRAIATILDSINTLRNHASIAHPNENLLEETEAMLVINSGRTMLNYIDKKMQNYKKSQSN